jgi:hypothetical protein
LSRQRRNGPRAGSGASEQDFAQKTKSLKMKFRSPRIKNCEHAILASCLVSLVEPKRFMAKSEDFTGTKVNDAIPTAIFLTMEFEQKHYMGFLSVNDAVLCRQLNTLLSEHIGRSIKEDRENDSCVKLKPKVASTARFILSEPLRF